MGQYPEWSRTRAARVGYLTGRGCTVEAIAADPSVGALSLKSLRQVMTRWKLQLDRTAIGGRLIDCLSTRERLAIEHAATARGIPANTLVLRLLTTIVSDSLIDAILDDVTHDGRSDARCLSDDE